MPSIGFIITYGDSAPQGRRPVSEPFCHQYDIIFDNKPHAPYASLDVDEHYNCPNPTCSIGGKHTYYGPRLVSPCVGYPWIPLARFDEQERPVKEGNYWRAVEGEGSPTFIPQEGAKAYLFGYGAVVLRSPKSAVGGWVAYRCDYLDGNPATIVFFPERSGWSMLFFGIGVFIGHLA